MSWGRSQWLFRGRMFQAEGRRSSSPGRPGSKTQEQVGGVRWPSARSPVGRRVGKGPGGWGGALSLTFERGPGAAVWRANRRPKGRSFPQPPGSAVKGRRTAGFCGRFGGAAPRPWSTAPRCEKGVCVHWGGETAAGAGGVWSARDVRAAMEAHASRPALGTDI